MRLAVLLAASLACVGIGFAKSAALSAHVKDLETLQKIIQYLRGEIVTAASPLPDAFWETGRRMRDPYRDFYRIFPRICAARTERHCRRFWKRIRQSTWRTHALQKKKKKSCRRPDAALEPGTAPCRRRIWTGMRHALCSGSRNCRKDCRKGRGSVRVLESWEAFFIFDSGLGRV